MTPDQAERTERLQVLLSLHEVAAIDEFRFENRMPNRGASGSYCGAA